jgi:multiple sugar transport system permease protein
MVDVVQAPHGFVLTSQRQESLSGYLLSAPAVLVLLLFLMLPILGAFALVFMSYNALEPPTWSGLANLKNLFADTRMWTCYRNSLVITIGACAGNNVVGLLLAMGVNRKIGKAFQYFFRTAYFFPVMTTTASLAMVWQFILTQDRGVMNWLLRQFGIGPVPFLTNPEWAVRSVILYDVWKSCGYLMVIYLAGLQGIPESLYEAAKIDGASNWQLTRHVTLPLITPTAFFCLIISSIGAFQIFDNAYVLTHGGPGDASRTIAMYIYEQGFRAFEFGYAATVSLSLLVILVALTLLQFWGSRRWVHYD